MSDVIGQNFRMKVLKTFFRTYNFLKVKLSNLWPKKIICLPAKYIKICSLFMYGLYAFYSARDTIFALGFTLLALFVFEI